LAIFLINLKEIWLEAMGNRNCEIYCEQYEIFLVAKKVMNYQFTLNLAAQFLPFNYIR
jgi:hypothetical protein